MPRIAAGILIPSIAPLQSDSQVMDCWQLNHANEFGQQAQMESTFLQQPVSDRLQEKDRKKEEEIIMIETHTHTHTQRQIMQQNPISR